jgi:hypothetical protein
VVCFILRGKSITSQRQKGREVGKREKKRGDNSPVVSLSVTHTHTHTHTHTLSKILLKKNLLKT